MVRLNSGNVLLKPSQRKQLMAWLRRSLRMGARLGDFLLTITMKRTGRLIELHATVHDRLGDFVCRSRKHDWRDVVRTLVRQLAARLHGQTLGRA